MDTMNQLMQEVNINIMNYTPMKPTNKNFPGAPQKTQSVVQQWVCPLGTVSNPCRCLFADDDAPSAVTLDRVLELMSDSSDEDSDDEDNMFLHPVEIVAIPQYTKW